MPIQVEKPTDDRWTKGLVYGDPGVGKTVFLASISEVKEMKEVLFANLEGGVTPLRKFYPDVDVVPTETVDEFNELYEFLAKHTKLRKELEKGNKKKDEIKKKLLKLEERIKPKTKIGSDPTIYKSIAIDSLTEIQKLIMANIMGRNPGNLTFDPDIELPRVKEWGQNSETVRLLVRTFRNLDMHVWFSAHKQREKDDSSGEVEILPSLPGKLPREIMGMLEVVGYMYTPDKNDDEDKFKNIMLAQNSGKFKAKDRYDALGSYIEMPTMKKVMKKIRNDSKKSKKGDDN